MKDNIKVCAEYLSDARKRLVLGAVLGGVSLGLMISAYAEKAFDSSDKEEE